MRKGLGVLVSSVALSLTVSGCSMMSKSYLPSVAQESFSNLESTEDFKKSAEQDRENRNFEDAWKKEARIRNLSGLIVTLDTACQNLENRTCSVYDLKKMYSQIKEFGVSNEQELSEKQAFLKRFGDEMRKRAEEYIDKNEFEKAWNQAYIIDCKPTKKKVAKKALDANYDFYKVKRWYEELDKDSE